MHILVIPSEHYIPEKSPLSGIFQYHHVNLLLEYNNKVGVISAGLVPFKFMFRKYPFKPFEKYSNCVIYRDYYRLFIPGSLALKFFWKGIIKKYLKLFENYVKHNGMPEMIHAHNSIFAGYVACEIKKKYNIPFVLTEHSSLYERQLLSQSQLDLAKESIRNTDQLTTVSTRLGKTLQRVYSNEKINFTPIFNVLEQRFFENTNQIQYKRNKSDSLVFLSIGSLDENKNHEMLIDAFVKLHELNNNIRLNIGGEGSLKEYLQNLIAKYNADSYIKLLGYLTRDEVRDELYRSDVFVLPSKVETFGVVLIEALSTGMPVIATKCGGPEDIVSNINGLLVDINESSLYEALGKMLHECNKYNPDDIKADCMNRFGRVVFYNKLNSIYNNILSNNKLN